MKNLVALSPILSAQKPRPLMRRILVSEAKFVLKEEKVLAFSSMKKLCLNLNFFLRWLNAFHYENYKSNSLDKLLNSWLEETSSETFEKIPNKGVLCGALVVVEHLMDFKLKLEVSWQLLLTPKHTFKKVFLSKYFSVAAAGMEKI